MKSVDEKYFRIHLTRIIASVDVSYSSFVHIVTNSRTQWERIELMLWLWMNLKIGLFAEKRDETIQPNERRNEYKWYDDQRCKNLNENDLIEKDRSFPHSHFCHFYWSSLNRRLRCDNTICRNEIHLFVFFSFVSSRSLCSVATDFCPRSVTSLNK